MIGCHSERTGVESEALVSERNISRVMNDHVARLMGIEGVTGVGLGETEEKTPCILILVIKESEEIKSKIPAKLEGHPVRLLVSGEIKPMKSD